MNTSIHFSSYLCHLFLEWDVFQTVVVEKIKTHSLCSITFFPFFLFEDHAVWDNVEKGFVAGQATDDNMAHEQCMLYTYTNTHTQVV